MDKTSSMYLYVKLNWDANRFLPAESKDCMNSASYVKHALLDLRVYHALNVRLPCVFKNACFTHVAHFPV